VMITLWYSDHFNPHEIFPPNSKTKLTHS
jgi:hypothetical protein